MHLSREARKIVIGSFLNLDALSNWLKDQQQNILLVCSGWKGNFNLEDTLFAGAVVEQLQPAGFTADDAAIAALDLYQLAKNDLNGYLKKTSHSERLKKLGIEKDIAFCLEVNTTTAIPVLEGERLVKLV